jgi:hypothetical protein
MSDHVLDASASPDASGTTTAGSPPASTHGKTTHRERWVEGISVALLAIASLTAAWCGYQATLWSGEQSAHYTEAGARRVESVRANGLATQMTQIDVSILTQWINANQAGDQELADFYESRFTPVLQPAFEAWMATDPFNNPDAPNSPFAMPEYQQPGLALSSDLEAEAAALFNQGQNDNKVSDEYVLATVFLATALFFLAVSTGLDWFWAQVALTGVAGAMVIVALGYMTTLGVAG